MHCYKSNDIQLTCVARIYVVSIMYNVLPIYGVLIVYNMKITP